MSENLIKNIIFLFSLQFCSCVVKYYWELNKYEKAEGKFKETEQLYLKTLSLDNLTNESKHKFLLGLGDLYAKCSRVEDAREAFNKAVLIENIIEQEKSRPQANFVAVLNNSNKLPAKHQTNGDDSEFLTHKHGKWRELKDAFKSKRAFLIGNGPSLNETPLHLLKNEFTLCFNRFNLMFERLCWKPTMYIFLQANP